MMVLSVGLVFVIVGSITDDFETYYDVEVNETLGGNYDYSGRINASVSGLIKNFEAMDEGERSWFVGTLYAIPLAIFSVISSVFISGVYSINIFTNIGSKIEIPLEIIAIGVTVIMIIIVFSVVSFWRRYKAIE